MKGYCKCGVEIDEVQFSQFKMCPKCYMEYEEKELKFATLDDTILFIYENAKTLPLATVNGMIQELKKVLEL